MDISRDIRAGRHCVFDMHVHLVFVTKYRKKIFSNEMLAFMKGIFEDICQKFEASLIECNGERDHIILADLLSPQSSHI